MITSIVIPFQHSRWADSEIKYALRSVEKHLTGYGDIFIVGDKPRSLKQGYTHIPGELDSDKIYYKERNIYRKLLAACEDKRVSADFLWMDDDHFLLSNYQADRFPIYCNLWPKRRTDIYQQTIDNTLNQWPADKFTFFNLHCPMVYNKAAFVNGIGSLDWEKKAGYCIQTAYMKLIKPRVRGEMYPDLKIKYIYPINELRRVITDRKWFSIDDGARGPEMERLLAQLYPNKSRFE